MEHGRNHDERQQKFPRSRSNNTPPDPDAEPIESNEEHARRGSEPAPTRRAIEHERERHERQPPPGATDKKPHA